MFLPSLASFYLMLHSTSQNITKNPGKKPWRWPKWAEMAKNGLKWPKKASKWGQNDTKNDAKTMPKWSLSDPKMTPFGLKTVQKWLSLARIKNGSKNGQERSKVTEKKTFKSHPDLHKSAYKHSKSTQDASRHTHLLHTHTFVSWNVGFDRFLSEISLRFLWNPYVFGNTKCCISSYSGPFWPETSQECCL